MILIGVILSNFWMIWWWFRACFWILNRRRSLGIITCSSLAPSLRKINLRRRTKWGNIHYWFIFINLSCFEKLISFHVEIKINLKLVSDLRSIAEIFKLLVANVTICFCLFSLLALIRMYWFSCHEITPINEKLGFFLFKDSFLLRFLPSIFLLSCLSFNGHSISNQSFCFSCPIVHLREPFF